MPKDIFSYVDSDKALQFLDFYWWESVRLWLHGIKEEPFFLHEVFKRHRMHPSPRDIGLRYPARVGHGLARLHQQGPRRSDAFGGDFALTVDITGAYTLRKTALIQSKLGNSLSTQIEHLQIKEALATPELKGRCFVMSVDRVRENIRLQSMDTLAAEFTSPSKASQQFDTGEWMASSDWLLKWLKCEVGIPSSTSEAASIETILRPFATEIEGVLPTYTSYSQERPRDRGEEPPWLPSVWHHFSIHISNEV